MVSSDWEFSVTTWEEDPADSVSSPAALAMWTPGSSSGRPLALALHSNAQAVDQGRLISWLKGVVTSSRFALLLCRNQSPVGTPNWYDTYLVRVTGSTAILDYVDSTGSSFTVGSWNEGMGSGIWQRIRLTWINGVDGSDNPATVFRLEWWDGSAWYLAGPDLYDTNERNKGSAVNRVGIGCQNDSGVRFRFDNTEIWGAS